MLICEECKNGAVDILPTTGKCIVCSYPPTSKPADVPRAETTPGALPPHRLVEFRARYSLRQSGLAKLLGCSTVAISSWENGKTKIPKYIQMALAGWAAGIKPYE